MRPVASTHVYRGRPGWDEHVDMIDRTTLSTRALFRRIVAAAGDHEAMILNGSIGWRERYVDLLAALAVRRTRRRPPAIVLTDCSWRLGRRRLDRALMRLGIRALDGPRVRYCVRSTAELEHFPATWGVDPAHVVFTHYGHTVTADELADPATREGPVWAGGNSLRDYAVLLAAADGLDADVHVATDRLPPDAPRPANVTIAPIPAHEEFVAQMRRASLVVTPLRPGLVRAAGLDTFLGAMALGKLVVVSDAPGVRDYVRDGETGIVVPPGDVGALRAALAWAVDPAHAEEVAAIEAAAAAVARTEFTYDAYARRVLDLALALAA